LGHYGRAHFRSDADTFKFSRRDLRRARAAERGGKHIDLISSLALSAAAPP
jgi:hypothetical protein